MELILFAVVFILVNIGLKLYMRWDDKKLAFYQTIYCRGDVRAEIGMIESQSDIEAKRKKLNSRKSKF